SSAATAPTDTYTLSLPDALPISATAGHPRVVHLARDREPRASVEREVPAVHGDACVAVHVVGHGGAGQRCAPRGGGEAGDGHEEDRKSTRLNSSHVKISYAVFCL